MILKDERRTSDRHRLIILQQLNVSTVLCYYLLIASVDHFESRYVCTVVHFFMVFAPNYTLARSLCLSLSLSISVSLYLSLSLSQHAPSEIGRANV